MYVRSSLFPSLLTPLLISTISELPRPSFLSSTESRHYPVDSSEETLRGLPYRTWTVLVQISARATSTFFEPGVAYARVV